jgi:hypothetical protein
LPEAFPHAFACNRLALFSGTLALYYKGMTPPDKNSTILLSLLRALSSLDKNFPLPCAIFHVEVARNEGC